jgi:nucleoside-diphosphate-sugar epimerase
MRNRIKKNLLICGATGFIGRNILQKFIKEKKYNIFAIYNNKKPFRTHKSVKWIKYDLRSPDIINKITKDINIVIQAAATTTGSKDVINQPFLHVTDNAVMNAYLFRSCFLNKVEHVIFFSCTTMYKSSSKSLKETDFNPLKDIDPKYFGVATTKVYNEKMCEFYSTLGKTKYTAIRHSNIYGPYDKFDLERSHVFGATITKVMTAKKEIIVWGKGHEKRDLLYIDDLVNFVKLVILKQKNNYELLNCGAGYAISIKELVKKIILISNKKIIIKYDITKPTIPTYLSVDCTKAKKLLGWKPTINLEKGIKKTLGWWKKNIR